MKNLKKLIPALCLLLISAMLLGTSTFAWFTMNTTVTASNLAVKATTGGNLLIALPAIDADSKEETQPAVSAFKTSVDFEMTADAASKLQPVSTSNLSNWFTAQAKEVSASTAKDGGFTPTLTGTEYLRKNFYLYAGSDMKIYLSNLTVKINDADPTGTNPLWQSIRVGVKVGNEFMIYAYTAETANGLKAGGGTEETAIAVKPDGSATALLNSAEEGAEKIFHVMGTDDDEYELASLSADTPTACAVFVWFEGTDGSCYTNNFQKDAVTVGFSISQIEPSEDVDTETT